MKRAIMLLALVGCSKADEAKDGEAKATEGASPTTTAPPASITAVIDAWKKGGLAPGELIATKGFGSTCQSSSVDKVEVVLCDFGKADEAKKAEKAGLDWVGDTTGAAWASGSVVVAVADRTKADPSGKTINKLMKLSPK
jgi:hypothetical protein